MAEAFARIKLFDSLLAPGYRRSMGERSNFTVSEDLTDEQSLFVRPAEGAGRIAQHLELMKLCDAGTDLDDARTFAPVREHPPRKRGRGDDPDAYFRSLERRGLEVRERAGGVQGDLSLLALLAFGAAERGDVHDLVRAQMPFLFEQFPHGSLWYIRVSDTLLARFAFARTQMAMELVPEAPPGSPGQLNGMGELTLTQGVDLSSVVPLGLLALSPSVLGFLVPAMPHALVFCFGTDVDLRRPNPMSLATLYRPRVLQNAEGLSQPRFLQAAAPADGERLLAWWVGRLNHIYSRATDPTRWLDESGDYDAAAQTAWLITVERLMGDLMSLLAEPQATDLDRVQIAFDLLDKAESLLGFSRKRTGKGFQALLRRRDAVPRLLTAFRASMPDELANRLGREASRLFDRVYADVRANTAAACLTPGGARVAGRTFSDDAYVSSLLRAIRNSSHGLLDVLREHDDRYLLASNTCGVPAEFPALAALIGLAMLADISGVVDGSFRARLVGTEPEG